MKIFFLIFGIYVSLHNFGICGEPNSAIKLISEIKNGNEIHVRLVNVSDVPVLIRVYEGRVPLRVVIESKEGSLDHEIMFESFINQRSIKKEFIMVNPARDYPTIHADQRLHRVIKLRNKSRNLSKEGYVSIRAEIESIAFPVRDEVETFHLEKIIDLKIRKSEED